jgi:hypothetical protein
MENPYTQQPPFDNGSSTGYPAQQSQYAPESHNLPPVPQQQHYTDPGAEAHGPGCGGCGRCAGCGTWLATSGAGQLLADLTGHLCRSRPLRPLPSALSFLSVRADAANAATAALRRHPSFSLPASSSLSLPRASLLAVRPPPSFCFIIIIVICLYLFIIYLKN